MSSETPLDRSLSRRDFTRLVGVAAAAAALPACARRGPSVGPDGMPLDGPYQVEMLETIMVPMRDGVRLATDVHLPTRSAEGAPLEGPWPVILERTPYGRNRPSRSERSLAEPDEAKSRAEVARIFAERGYVVIYQDVRGRYDSEGVYQKYLDDAPDGYDSCAWILEQPWCDGRIGTKGLSYAAHTQGALASAGAPGVAAMFLDSGGSPTPIRAASGRAVRSSSSRPRGRTGTRSSVPRSWRIRRRSRRWRRSTSTSGSGRCRGVPGTRR